MSSIKSHIIYIAIIVILLLVLGIALGRPEKVVEVVKHNSDTIVIEKIDTVTISKIVEVEKTTVDTLYIVHNDTIRVPVPISTYRFHEQGLYDITAKGYEVSILEVTVFPKTVYETILEEREREVTRNYWDIYFGGGIWRYNQEWIPNIAATIKTPQNFLFGANLGYYDKGFILGGTIQYKITHKRK